jgi:hypothetical protein
VKRHALQQLAVDLKRADVDCALVTEAWLTKRHLDQYVSIDGYKMFRRDRKGGDGGGVCIYIRNNIDCNFVNLGNAITRFQKLWLSFKYHSNIYYVLCCYHPPAPRYKPADLIAELTNDIDEIMQRNDSSPFIIVSGDFNGLNKSFY